MLYLTVMIVLVAMMTMLMPDLMLVAGRVTPPLSHFSSAQLKLNSVPDIIHSKLRLSFVVVLNYVFMKLPLIVTVIVGSNIFNSMAAPFSRHKILGNHFCLF